MKKIAAIAIILLIVVGLFGFNQVYAASNVIDEQLK